MTFIASAHIRFHVECRSPSDTVLARSYLTAVGQAHADPRDQARISRNTKSNPELLTNQSPIGYDICINEGSRWPVPNAQLKRTSQNAVEDSAPSVTIPNIGAAVWGDMSLIRKAVFPVAGLGTRFLPATKAMPKEMLPVVDRPLIQHVVDEAREAGIEHFIFVTGRDKHIIEDHFDRQVELEKTLHQRQRGEILEFLARELPPPGTTSFTRQQEPLGLGHALWCARELVGAEPFALLLPDVLIHHNPGCLKQMISSAASLDKRANLIAIEEVPRDQVQSYGVVGVGTCENGLFPITKMIEKPAISEAPSHLIITGRYILQPEIFDILAVQKRGAGGEIQLTDAMIALSQAQPFYGLKFAGRSYDCSSKIGFLMAALRLSLYFGNSPEFWMNLQTHYDLKMAQRNLKPEDAKRIKSLRAA
jgi:UTP--glucose-1-phosphate uridylyltransferase